MQIFYEEKKKKILFSLTFYSLYFVESYRKEAREKKEAVVVTGFHSSRQQTQNHTINKMKVQKFFHDVQNNRFEHVQRLTDIIHSLFFYLYCLDNKFI